MAPLELGPVVVITGVGNGIDWALFPTLSSKYSYSFYPISRRLLYEKAIFLSSPHYPVFCFLDC